MVIGIVVECLGCSARFVFRLAVSYHHDTWFRIGCPVCHCEIDGEMHLDYRSTDGVPKPAQDQKNQAQGREAILQQDTPESPRAMMSLRSGLSVNYA